MSDIDWNARQRNAELAIIAGQSFTTFVATPASLLPIAFGTDSNGELTADHVLPDGSYADERPSVCCTHRNGDSK